MISIAGGEDVAGPPGLKSPEVGWGELAGPRPRRRRRDALRLVRRATRAPRRSSTGSGSRRSAPARVFAVDAASTFSRPGPAPGRRGRAARPPAPPRPGRPAGQHRLRRGPGADRATLAPSFRWELSADRAGNSHRNGVEATVGAVSGAEGNALGGGEAPRSAVFMPVRPPSTFEETVERLGTRDPARTAGAGEPAAAGARAGAAAADLALDPAPGADGAGAERPPGLAARPRPGAPSSPSEPPLARQAGEPLDQGGLGGPRLPGRDRDRGGDARRRAGQRRAVRPPRGAGREDGRRPDDFEEYRRTDIRFHIGIAEAAAVAAAGDAR